MRHYFLVLIFLAFISCKKDEIKIEVIACFDYTPVNDAQTGDILTFSNCSENAKNYLWDFGDGTISDSETPHHSFENGGNYIVKLTAINGNFDDTISKNIQITDKHFTDLHDTIISVQWANGGRDFNLDIDNDSIDDVKFTVYSYYSKYVGSEDYLQITPLNGFELAFTNYQTTTWSLHAHWIDTLFVTDTLFVIDTVLVPKVFDLGDTIFVGEMYSAESQMISYSKSPSAMGRPYYSGLRYGVKKGDYFYLGLYKLYNEKPRLAWLKVKPILYGIILNSSSYNDEEKLVIKEKI